MKWESYRELFNSINENCNYLVIRNFECLPNTCIGNGHDDIDFLCDDKEQFITAIGAKLITPEDYIHCLVDIDDVLIRVDIRSVGDGYFDETWQKEMLRHRKKNSDDVFVMSDMDYYYSLAYHEIYHKNELRDEYKDRLMRLADRIGISFSEGSLKHDLDCFMKMKGYIETGYRSLK